MQSKQMFIKNTFSLYCFILKMEALIFSEKSLFTSWNSVTVQKTKIRNF